MNNYSLDLAYVEINSEKYLNVISYQEKLSLSSLPEIALEFLVEKKINIDEILYAKAAFVKNNLKITGFIGQVKQVTCSEKYYNYSVGLQHEVYQLNENKKSRVFSNATINDLIHTLFSKQGIAYDLRLNAAYGQEKIFHQYQETDWNFLSRHLERHGIYYYFDYSEDGKIVFIDDKSLHQSLTDKVFISNDFAENRSRQCLILNESVFIVPNQVIVQSYNPLNAEQLLTATIQVTDHGHSDHYHYIAGAGSQEELERLGNVYAQSFGCLRHTYTLCGEIINAYPGKLINVIEQGDGKAPQKYLIYAMKVCGKQKATTLIQNEEVSPIYECSLYLIPADIQYRSKMSSTVPNIAGFIHASAHGSCDSEYAHLDDFGYYEVTLRANYEKPTPFKARKVEVFAGKNYGMHFPIKVGTELLVGFIHGYPESPIIIGSGYNSDHVNVVNSQNSYDHIIRSESGSEIRLSDQAGSAGFEISHPGYSLKVTTSRES
ncbi:hypothetical protein AVI51_03635 [Piscirickettsia salmonis]|uniref:Type VI secretion system Vgr family protein n=1 Tax=Piscirickettsia salmonis TaxID=1238 RepID=A0A9Q5YGW5_PISSA|nr:type VI secretion system tip protein TssI/VgrG [Piscirickettsia salmonis]ALA25167.1 rhs element Vgr family protein [Piscirickettsia salmonis]APS45436.1 hypothetical protein AVI48_14350 [Piscirickettsia salmonis]APS48797.1 hypothetical protein AVI49_14965 [Piscirickettsia salmonis]APS50034.1 hypothetical protein AVI50_03670 [Piscirickettsia salmonis]APS53233.1 hypothetical protein AVI51_03635 [Piscirickettsia salmonis]